MKKVCAWCRRTLDGEDVVGGDFESRGVVSHGICEPCAVTLFDHPKQELRSFLDNIAAPVVVVDRDGVVQTANGDARQMLGKDLPQIEGLLGGDVFECAYATLPGGCGNTEHCTACTVRRAVMSTLQSGEPVVRHPVRIIHGSTDEPRRQEMRISTERVGEVVLLRIDDVAAA